MIQKWRASGKAGTIIARPTKEERMNAIPYAKKCDMYAIALLKAIIEHEENKHGKLILFSPEYYYKRYDVTAVEHSMLRAEIIENL